MNTVAVFGEMLVDRFPTGPVVGGAPFNVARHLGAFGHDPLMIGAVGRDAAGALVREEFARYGLREDGLQQLPSRATGEVEVRMHPGGAHQFVIRGDAAWDHVALPPARQALGEHPRGWFYAGTLALRAPTTRETQLALMRAHEGRIFLDINWREGMVDASHACTAAGLAHVIKVNEDELPMLCQWFGQPAPPADAGELVLGEVAMGLLRQLSLRMLLVTLGPRGALCAQNRGVTRVAPRRAVRVVDTVGAGDAFAAVALAGLLRGWTTGEMLQRAVDFSGHICEVRGAVPGDMAAYREWTAGWRSPSPDSTRA